MNIVTVAKALVIDEAQNCLILRRSDTHPHVPLTPDLPGGQVDEDESPHDAVVREIAEETALTVRPAQTQLVYASTEIDRNRNVIRLLYVTRVAGVKPKVTISWEHSEAWWVPLGTISQELTHQEYLKGIAYLAEHGILNDIVKE
jgi:ADP-ribose pyrophosphatase YjhB (NUDIX family)